MMAFVRRWLARRREGQKSFGGKMEWPMAFFHRDFTEVDGVPWLLRDMADWLEQEGRHASFVFVHVGAAGIRGSMQLSRPIEEAE